MIILSNTDIEKLSFNLFSELKAKQYDMFNSKDHIKLYGVPRGGICVAYMLKSISGIFKFVDSPEDADIIVDDLIDSGTTKEKFSKLFPNTPFHVLIDKTTQSEYNDWIVFPWEESEAKSISEDVERVIQYLNGYSPTALKFGHLVTQLELLKDNIA